MKITRSFLVTEDLARRAVGYSMATISAMMLTGAVNRPHLHIVVLNPAYGYAHDRQFSNAILYEQSVGNEGNWEYDYRAIAQSKAEVSWRTGLPSLRVQQEMPGLYMHSDTVHAGSAVHAGIIVACSGVQWYFDQMFSYHVAATIQALAIEASTKIRDRDDVDFYAYPG